MSLYRTVVQRPAPSRATRIQALFVAGMLLVPLGCFALAAVQIAEHCEGTSPQPLRAASAVLLILFAVLQACFIARWFKQSRPRPLTRVDAWKTLRVLLVGVGATYGICLAAGLDRSAVYAFRAAAALWATLCVAWLLDSAVRWPRLERLVSSKTLLAGAWIVVALFGIELAARGWLHSQGSRELVATAVALASQRDDGFGPRVLVVGDESVSSADAPQVGMRVVRAATNRAGVEQYAAAVPELVERLEVNAVVVYFSVADVVAEPAVRSLFRWQDLGLARLAANWGLLSSPELRRQSPDGELAPDLAAKELSICRAPLDERLRRRWESVEAAIADAARACRGQGVEVVLVAVPADFQIDPLRLARASRQAGYQDREIDPVLPQRRLAVIGSRSGIDVLDPRPELAALGAAALVPGGRGFTPRGRATIDEAVGRWLDARLARTASTKTLVSQSAR